DFMRGDQYTFHLKRIPSVMFTSLEHDDYHTPADDPEKIDYEFLQKSCQLIYEIILELANGDINLIDQGFN
ncbi:MAG: M28 family peptidase, partial [Bacteroidales bacterium]|nr:M28 family peptidase [Bacteroidales bacterium]